MLNKYKIRLSVGFFILSLLSWPVASYADWGHHGERHFYRYHDHPHFGVHISFLPRDYFTVWVGGARFYYCDGLYYDRVGTDYVVVAPPVGAIVTAIPTDYQPVVVNGVTYYYDSGTYYVYTPAGYQVVPPPVVQSTPVIQSSPATAPANPAPTVSVTPSSAPATSTETEDSSFTVNIPNDKGGYTAVVIKKSGNGFVGPQGEFYSEFPKVSQLKVMYGKQ